MTEPIAVDAPAKPAFSRSGPLPAAVGPLAEALAGAPSAPASTSSAPKAEPPKSAPKSEAPKTEAPKPPTPASGTPATAAVAAVTVAAAATGVPPVAVAPMTGLLAKFTKKQLTIGAAVCSLFVGAGALRLLFPAKDAPPKTETAANEKALHDKVPPTQPPVPAPAKPPAVQEVPHTEPGSGLPPLPSMPPAPVNNPHSSARPTGITPVAPPAVFPDARPTTNTARPEPDFTVPPFPGPVTPAAGAVPSTPPAGGTHALPAAPAFNTHSATPPLPGLPAPPMVTPEPKPPAIAPPPDLAPVLPPLPGGNAPKPTIPQPEMPGFPAVTPAPVTPKPPEGPVPPPGGTSGPGVSALPPLPGGTGTTTIPAPVDVTPKLPALPYPKPMGGTAPPVLHGTGTGMGTGTSGMSTPNVLPFPGHGMNPTPKPSAPVFDPPSPAFPGPSGTPTGFTKPAGATEVKPTAPERAPKTSYDVDVYDPKLGDTYESISQEWYNSKQYAAALRAYNQNQALQGGRYVNVPPLYVLQKQPPSGNVGTSGVRPSAAPTADAPNWSASPDARPAAPGRGTFIVPQGGMTPLQVARQTMGTEQRWRDIYDLNPKVQSANELLPAGTELKMPLDAKLP